MIKQSKNISNMILFNLAHYKYHFICDAAHTLVKHLNITIVSHSVCSVDALQWQYRYMDVIPTQLTWVKFLSPLNPLPCTTSGFRPLFLHSSITKRRTPMSSAIMSRYRLSSSALWLKYRNDIAMTTLVLSLCVGYSLTPRKIFNLNPYNTSVYVFCLLTSLAICEKM